MKAFIPILFFWLLLSKLRGSEKNDVFPPTEDEDKPNSSPLEDSPYSPTPTPDLQPASFEKSARRAAIAEGGYQNYYDDNGNWTGCKVGVGQRVGTNYGITACTYKSFFGRTPSVADMKGLTKSQALAIYKKLYWDRVKGDQILNQPLADIIFDGQLQHSKNVKLLQQAINFLFYEPALNIDNVFGPKTLKAVNFFAAQNPAILYKQYKDERIKYYQLIVQNNPSQQVFLNGWMNRINQFADYV